MSYKNHRVAVIIPAHNEQKSIAQVITELTLLMHDGARLVDEIIVCDNASTDNTVGEALDAGAKVVYEPELGYGSACLRAIDTLKNRGDDAPKLVAFVDGDQSIKTDELPRLLKEIERGADLVVGSRAASFAHKSALSSHRLFSTALAKALIQYLWKRSICDVGPFRVIRYSRLLELNMQNRGTGWMVEMQVKTLQAGFTYAEVPVTVNARNKTSRINDALTSTTIGAALGISKTIYKLYKKEREFLESLNRANSLSNL